jgi:hypothetical protein
MPKKISADKDPAFAHSNGKLTRGSAFALASMATCTAIFLLIEPVCAQTASPVTITKVFDPDLADVKLGPEVKQAIKDAVEKAKPSTDGCYPAAIPTFTAHQKASGDPGFDHSLGQARAEALQQALTGSLGYGQDQFKTDFASGSADDVEVTYKPGKDTDAPRLKVTSNPPKGTKVKTGDKIHLTIIGSERYADGHKSWPTGVKSLQLTANDGVVASKDYGQPPQACARQTLEATYTVPSNPPEIIHLHAIAEDGVGNQAVEDGDFPTSGDYFGKLKFRSQQQVPAGTQYFTGDLDITLKRDSKGNLTGTLSGTQSEKLVLSTCPSETITPGRVAAKLNGVLKGTTISLDVSDGSASAPIMTPCNGRQPGTASAVYAWPHFALVFHDLTPAANGSYHFDQEWTNPGGGFPFTEHYALQLDPVK